MFDPVDWQGMFMPDMPLLEIFLRGTLMYLGIFTILRVMLKREAGDVGITDMLVVVLIADAAQNGMAGDYKSMPDGLLLVATIVFWSYMLDCLAFRYDLFHRMVNPSKIQLIDNGQIIMRNLEKEKMRPEDLESLLREQGIESIANVRKAYMESDGQVSAITYGGKRRQRG